MTDTAMKRYQFFLIQQFKKGLETMPGFNVSWYLEDTKNVEIGRMFSDNIENKEFLRLKHFLVHLRDLLS